MKDCDNWPQRVKMLKRDGWMYHDGLFPFWEKGTYKRLVKDLMRISDNKFLNLLEVAE